MLPVKRYFPSFNRVASMIYLSAQPDEYYFKWQLQLQLYNFRQLGIAPETIHVLIGFHPEEGISEEFTQLMRESKEVSFFAYPDLRKVSNYKSSIRPHIISQHFRAHPHLQQEIIFYHDSDILFRCLPDEAVLLENETWYASNTRSYLGLQYLTDNGSPKLLEEMCAAAGITSAMVEHNDHHAGGAQYVLKQCTAAFWEELETVAEKIYLLISSFNAERGLSKAEAEYAGVQAWCADMWALWWLALKHGVDFQTHPELDFCWADSDVEIWQKKKILHYTGSVGKDNTAIFRKAKYAFYPPFLEDHSMISHDTCSIEVIRMIRSYAESLREKRVPMKDVAFLIHIQSGNVEDLQNVHLIIAYLTGSLGTNIILLETGTVKQMDTLLLPSEVNYLFVQESDHCRHDLHYAAAVIPENIPIIAWYDPGTIIPLSQLTQSVALLREKRCNIIAPYNGETLQVDSLLKEIFRYIMDANVFCENKGKFHAVQSNRKETLIFNRSVISEEDHSQPFYLEDGARYRLPHSVMA